MSDEVKTNEKHGLWHNALKMVKGTSTEQLMEDFTAEMTLVAEGLCEDQSVIRRELDSIRAEQDRVAQELRSELQVQETTIGENQRDVDKKLDEITRRLNALEKSHTAKENKDTKLSVILSKATVLVGILAGSWIIVTILNMLSK